MQETIDNQLKIINLLQKDLINSLDEGTAYRKRTLISGDKNRAIETEDYVGGIIEMLDSIEDATRIYLDLKANLD